MTVYDLQLKLLKFEEEGLRLYQLLAQHVCAISEPVIYNKCLIVLRARGFQEKNWERKPSPIFWHS